MKLLNKQSGIAHMMVIVVAAVLVVGVIGAVVYQKSHAATYNCYPNTYSTNGVGKPVCIRIIQRMVTATTSGISLSPDGIYGPKTKAGVKKFQMIHGLSGEADGIVGHHTWDKLCVSRSGSYYASLRYAAGCPGATPYRTSF